MAGVIDRAGIWYRWYHINSLHPIL